MPRIRTLVIILAGGAGGGLELLTQGRAKPARWNQVGHRRSSHQKRTPAGRLPRPIRALRLTVIGLPGASTR
jgi:hypothetical protein